MTNLTEIIFPGVIGLIILVFFMKFGLKWLYLYQITGKKLEVRLLGIIPIWYISFTNIKSISIVNPFQVSLFEPVFRLGNRLAREAVLIEFKNYILFKSVLISPDDPALLIEEIKEKMASSS